MVGMDTVEPSSRGVLGVVIRERAESPEEQYDRLVSRFLLPSVGTDCCLVLRRRPLVINGNRLFETFRCTLRAALYSNYLASNFPNPYTVEPRFAAKRKI